MIGNLGWEMLIYSVPQIGQQSNSNIKKLSDATFTSTATVNDVGIKTGNLVQAVMGYSIPVYAVNAFGVDESATTRTT